MFISFTGIDGSGKTTQIDLLSKYLIAKGHDLFISEAYTRKEKELFQSYIQEIDQIAIMFLFQAFHTQQYLSVKDSLDKNKTVIADRWDESYQAYHSIYGILAKNPNLRNELNFLAFQNLKPEVCFFIDTDPKVTIERTKERGQDYFDKLSMSYHVKMSLS